MLIDKTQIVQKNSHWNQSNWSAETAADLISENFQLIVMENKIKHMQANMNQMKQNQEVVDTVT